MITVDVLEKVCTQILEEHEPTLKTGFSSLDDVLRDIDKSSLITIGARPAIGKACFMTNIMLNLLEQNKKCLFFSFEMSEKQLLKRLLAQIAEVNSMYLCSSGAITKRKKELEKFVEAVNKIKDYNLTIFDDTKTNVKDIRKKVKKNKPDYIFIDYLQRINIPNKKPRIEAMEEVMINLKKVAKENNCTIFLTSQLSNAVENRKNKKPYLSDLRDNTAIEDVSDVIIFIHREEYYHEYEESKDFAYKKGLTEIFVAKNNYGPTVSFELLFKSSILKFFDPTKNNDLN